MIDIHRLLELLTSLWQGEKSPKWLHPCRSGYEYLDTQDFYDRFKHKYRIE